VSPSYGQQCQFNEYHWKGGSGAWSNVLNWNVKTSVAGHPGNIFVQAISIPQFSQEDIYFDLGSTPYTVTVDVPSLSMNNLYVGTPSLGVNLVFQSSSSPQLQTIHVGGSLSLQTTSSITAVGTSFAITGSASLLGKVSLTGCTLQGNWTVGTDSTLDVMNAGNFTGTTLINLGVINFWTGDVQLIMSNIYVRGAWNIYSANTYFVQSSVVIAGSASFLNQQSAICTSGNFTALSGATLLQTAGIWSFQQCCIFQNYGSHKIQVTIGQNVILSLPSIVNYGTLDIQTAKAQYVLFNSNLINSGTVSLSGNGTVNITTISQGSINSQLTIFNTTLNMTGFSQLMGARLLFVNSTLNSPNNIAIANGYASLSGVFNTPNLMILTVDGTVQIFSTLIINGDLSLNSKATIYLSVFGYKSGLIPNVVVNGNLDLSCFLLLDPGLDGHNIQIGDTFSIFRSNYVLIRKNSFLMGTPYKNTDYAVDKSTSKVIFTVVFSYGSVVNPDYGCTYLGDQKVLEYIPYHEQGKIFLALTIPQRDTNVDVGFGFDINGTITDSVVSRANPANGQITQYQHGFPHISPNYIIAGATKSLNIFAVGPLYYTITVLVPLPYLTSQKYIYYAEIVNGSESNHTWNKYSFRLLNDTAVDCTDFVQPSRAEVYGTYGIGIIFVLNVYSI
jgi:hypothetical protein